MVVGPILNRHARESNRLRAARAREHDDGVSRCGALPSAALSGRCVQVIIEPRTTPRQSEGESVVLGPNPNRPARESIQLRASRARERDKRDSGVAVRHASELSVLSTHRAEGLAATIRGRKA